MAAELPAEPDAGPEPGRLAAPGPDALHDTKPSPMRRISGKRPHASMDQQPDGNTSAAAAARATGKAKAKTKAKGRGRNQCNFRSMFNILPSDADPPVRRAAKLMLVRAGHQQAKKLYSNLEALQRNFGAIKLITVFSGSEVQECPGWPKTVIAIMVFARSGFISMQHAACSAQRASASDHAIGTCASCSTALCLWLTPFPAVASLHTLLVCQSGEGLPGRPSARSAS